MQTQNINKCSDNNNKKRIVQMSFSRLQSVLMRQRLALFVITLFTLNLSQWGVADAPIPAEIAPKASQSLLIDITRAGDNYVVVGERGHILVSEDKGQSWQQATVPVNVMLNAVHFVDEITGFAAGYDGHIIQSIDSGKTWTLVRNGLSAQAEMNAKAFQQAKQKVGELEEQLAQPELPSSDELMLKEALDEAQWQLDSAKDKLDSAIVASPILDIWFSDRNNGWVVGAFGTVLKSSDGGATWNDHRANVPNEMEFHLNAVSGLADGSVVIAGEAGFVAVSNDQGVSFTLADLGYEGTVFDVKASPSGHQLVATGLRGKTFIAGTDLFNWTDITPDVGFSLAGLTFMTDDQFLLVGHGGTLALSNDN
ncbi:MAG: YCF48-related protein, partial [Cellvibrionales bacterium]|nr:YCF48-related protein [Cellvibrionales bacterium]